MCICINHTIHTISYHRPVLNVLGWKCKHYSSALPPERLKRGLFSISHTSFGIALTRRCGWSLDDNWKIITYEPTFQATSPTQNIEIIHHMIFMKEIWRSHHLKIVWKKPVVKSLDQLPNSTSSCLPRCWEVQVLHSTPPLPHDPPWHLLDVGDPIGGLPKGACNLNPWNIDKYHYSSTFQGVPIKP